MRVSVPCAVVERDAVAEVRHAVLHGRRALLSDVDAFVGATAACDGDGVVDVPLFAELAFEREDLDAVVLAVGNDDGVGAEHRDVVGQAELARVGPGFAPGVEQAAFAVEAMDAEFRYPSEM